MATRPANGGRPVLTVVNQAQPTPADAAAAALMADERPRTQRKRRLLLWAWVFTVVLYFSWEAATYSGLFAYLTEWQFDHIGQDLPTFTFGLLTTLLAWPALRLFRRRARRAEDDEEDGAARALQNDVAAAIDSSRDYFHWLSGFAAALGLAAAAALAYTLTLPTLEGSVREVRLSGIAEPAEGPVALVGTIGYGRVASFSRGILFLRRSELYAPVMPPGARRVGIRYFVEFNPDERAEIHGGIGLTRRRGILVRNDMPGALIRLYRYLGYLPADRYYVLYASAKTIRWPYYIFALQFGLGALVFAVAALFQRRHLGRIARAGEVTRSPASLL